MKALANYSRSHRSCLRFRRRSTPNWRPMGENEHAHARGYVHDRENARRLSPRSIHRLRHGRHSIRLHRQRSSPTLA
jgi:hypothetical protein